MLISLITVVVQEKQGAVTLITITYHNPINYVWVILLSGVLPRFRAPVSSFQPWDSEFGEVEFRVWGNLWLWGFGRKP